MIIYTTSSVGVSTFFFVLYIDYIPLASNDLGLLQETKRFLARKFEMKDLGDAFFVLVYRYTEIALKVFLDYHKRAILINA